MVTSSVGPNITLSVFHVPLKSDVERRSRHPSFGATFAGLAV